MGWVGIGLLVGPCIVSLGKRCRQGFITGGRTGVSWEEITISGDGEKPLESLKQGSEVSSFLPLIPLWMLAGV